MPVFIALWVPGAAKYHVSPVIFGLQRLKDIAILQCCGDPAAKTILKFRGLATVAR